MEIAASDKQCPIGSRASCVAPRTCTRDPRSRPPTPNNRCWYAALPAPASSEPNAEPTCTLIKTSRGGLSASRGAFKVRCASTPANSLRQTMHTPSSAPRTDRTLLGIGLVLLTALAGCAGSVSAAGGDDAANHQPSADANSHAEPKQPATTWASCYAGFKPSGLLESDLRRLTRDCAERHGMSAVTPVAKANQSAKALADRYTFFVPSAGYCYRVVAVGSAGVSDLDLLIRTPDGEQVAADITHDKYPVLPPQGPLCFDIPGLYVLEVSVFEGSGRYAVQVWGGQRP